MDGADGSAGRIMNFDHCAVCGETGDLTCCDGCPQAFHSRCVSVPYRQKLDNDKWYCPQCSPDTEAEGPAVEKYVYVDILQQKCRPVDETCTSEQSLPQLNLILQYLDWFIGPEEVTKLAQVFQFCPTFSPSASSDTPAIERGVCFNSLIRSIRNAVSADLFDRAYFAIKNKDVMIAVGLARSRHYGLQTCPKCRAMKCSRYYCCLCGYIFSIKNELSDRSKSAVGRCKSWLEKNSKSRQLDAHRNFSMLMTQKAAMIDEYMRKNESSSADLAKDSCSDLSGRIPATSTQSSSSAADGDPAVTRHQGAALAGLDHMYYVSFEEKFSKIFSGDHLFLLRSMFVASKGYIHDVARKYFEESVVRWVNTESRNVGDPDCLTDHLEALHVLKQLLTPESILHQRVHESKNGAVLSGESSTSAGGAEPLSVQQQLYDLSGCPILQSGVDGFCFNRPRVHNLNAWREIEKKMDSASPPGVADIEVDASFVTVSLPETALKRRIPGEATSPTRDLKQKRRRLKHNLSDTSLSGGVTDYGYCPANNRVFTHHEVEEISIGSQKITVNLDFLRSRIKTALNFKTLNEIVGAKMLPDSLTPTPKNYCSNCGHDHAKASMVQNCETCGHVMKQKVDYGSLCDGLVFSYLVEDLGVDFICGSEQLHINDIVKLLPLARSYQRIDELGTDTFKWQCYFLTHVIYVFSDWGQHALSRQLFSEEFEFMLSNMDLAIRLNDPEIVGEFLQCLKLLGVDEWEDDDIWHVVEAGHEYLIKLEQSIGGNGRWLTARSLKTQYHASYCASIGLQSYNFSSLGYRRLPTPGIVRLLSQDMNMNFDER